MMYISSQRYTNQDIVDAKIAAADFDAYYISINFDGMNLNVVVDGHHSIAAAKQTGNPINWIYADAVAAQMPSDAEQVLDAQWMDSDWYDVETGKDVW